MKITIKESCFVRPEEDTPKRNIWLSNMDLIQGSYHLSVVCMYEPDGASNVFDVKALKEALSKALVTFYPIAGRFGRDERGRIQINCNGEGVLFVEAETDSPMTDFDKITPGSIDMPLVPKVDYSRDICSYPLFVVQVTRFSCGGVCLGLAGHHQVVDGEAISYFINLWFEIARGNPTTNIEPVLERSVLRARDPPNPKFYHTEYDLMPKFNIGSQDQDPEPLSTAILKLPVGLIDALKAKVKDWKNDEKYSTFEIVAAHLWRCYSKARNLPDDQENVLMIPVDGRYRFNPPLPIGYFGNVIFHATPVVSTGELISESLAATVERIHKAVVQVNDDYLRSAIDYIEQKNKSDERIQLAKPTLCVNSWIRLPIKSIDFGWGRPTVILPACKVEAMIVLLPSFTKDEDLSFFVCLKNENMKSLENLYVLE